MKMKIEPVRVKVFVLPGGTMPEKALTPDGKVDHDNAGFDVTGRGIVVWKKFVPERPFERELVWDFKGMPTRPFTDSTPHAGLSFVVNYGAFQTAKFTIGAMMYFGCGSVLDMPESMYAIVSRSSTIEKGLKVKNPLEVINHDVPIDRGFCAESVMAIHNWTNYFVEIGHKDLKLGQLIFPGYPNVELVRVKSYDELERKPRGNGCGGSTDKHIKK